jgi:tRNA(Ile)-lysidine synthase
VNDFAQRVAKSIETRRLYRRRERILVAVSGGLDSMVLLHLLLRLAPDYNWHLAVAHFNHRLRGRSSDADERLVRDTARRMGLRFLGAGADVKAFAKRHKLSVEMAARQLRHEFLARAARKCKARCIALAHHADDQVELFFLRLLRGAGSEGLAGMKWRSPSSADAKVMLTRPLMGESRESLASCASEEGIVYREDASNARLDIQRNRLRHELLPLLKRHYQRGLSRVVLRQMEITAAEAEFVSDAARKWLRGSRGRFELLPLALQRRCLQWELTAKGVLSSFDLIEQLREAANQPVMVNEKCSVYRDDSGRVRVQSAKKAGFIRTQMKVQLRGSAGGAEFDGAVVRWEVRGARAGTVRAHPIRVNLERFDADKVGRAIVLRHWRPGDRFQPIGMGSAVKLQDLFVNAKVPKEERHRLLVAATANGEVFWVEGLRLSERFKLDSGTTRQLHWMWKRV